MTLLAPLHRQHAPNTTDPDVNLGVWDVVESDGMIVLRNNRIAPRGVA